MKNGRQVRMQRSPNMTVRLPTRSTCPLLFLRVCGRTPIHASVLGRTHPVGSFEQFAEIHGICEADRIADLTDRLAAFG